MKINKDLKNLQLKLRILLNLSTKFLFLFNKIKTFLQIHKSKVKMIMNYFKFHNKSLSPFKNYLKNIPIEFIYKSFI